MVRVPWPMLRPCLAYRPYLCRGEVAKLNILLPYRIGIVHCWGEYIVAISHRHCALLGWTVLKKPISNNRASRPPTKAQLKEVWRVHHTSELKKYTYPRLLARQQETAQELHKIPHNQMCNAMPAKTPETALLCLYEAILHAQISE
eukprot:6191782-Pleurochrysis_carterae.AAC.3